MIPITFCNPFPPLHKDRAHVTVVLPPSSDVSDAFVLQIWSMKKNEEAAAKKKPKMSAAQLRVQKGK